MLPGVTYRPKIGDKVTAQPFPCDGAERVTGRVISLWPGMVLLDRPHGRWVPADGVEPLTMSISMLKMLMDECP